mmetsp:Transcript_33248/g.78520  ORF Transcript_33248/g.78520 Transcript_33248/m.78520 type:complete len:226 (+) Transcript_33248:282-959(+)
MLKLVMPSVAAAMSVPAQSPSGDVSETVSPVVAAVGATAAAAPVGVSFRAGRSTMVAVPVPTAPAKVAGLLPLLSLVTPLFTLANKPPAKLLALSMASLSCRFLSSEAAASAVSSSLALPPPPPPPPSDRSLARWIFRSSWALYLRRRRPSMDRNSSTVLGPAPNRSSRTRLSVRSNMVEKSNTVTLSLASAMPSLVLDFCARYGIRFSSPSSTATSHIIDMANS